MFRHATALRPGATLAAGAVILLLLSACSAPGGSADAQAASGDTAATATSGADLTGSWVLTDNADITLTVEADGAASGKSACNRYMTTITTDSATQALTVAPIAGTRMMCEEAVMTAEQDYLDALAAVTSGEVTDGQLVLTTADGATLVFDAA